MARQRLGQHFLTSGDTARRILDLARMEPSDNIVEIGPGRGILTREILGRGNPLAAIELDREMAGTLAKRYGKSPSFRVFTEDAARFDYSRLKRPFKVISNLPYCSALPILFQLLAHKDRVSLMALMFQQEVAERLVASPGGKSYNPLSILVQYHTAATLAFPVGRENFSPRPKVDSAVVCLAPYPTPPLLAHDVTFFSQLVKKAFSQRRKKIINNLKTLPMELERIKEACAISGILPGQRAETVSLEGFVKLSDALSA